MDGEGYPTDRPATRRELDTSERHLQRQIDAMERSVDERVRDVRDEMRRLSEAISKGMAEIAQKLDRVAQDRQNHPPTPPPPLISRNDLQEMKKAGTPTWVLLLIGIGGVLVFFFLRKLGAL